MLYGWTGWKKMCDGGVVSVLNFTSMGLVNQWYLLVNLWLKWALRTPWDTFENIVHWDTLENINSLKSIVCVRFIDMTFFSSRLQVVQPQLLPVMY